MRGDVNGDKTINITDAISILFQLFETGFTSTNLDALDVDDDGNINITDAINLLEFLFLGGEKPAQPFSYLGRDVTEDKIPACVEN